MSLQSPNRSSLLGWVKNFKKLAISNDSLNEVDNNNNTNNNNTININNNNNNSNQNFNNNNNNVNNNLNDEDFTSNAISNPINIYPHNSNNSNSVSNSNFSNSPKNQEFLRPLLHHKSRSTNNLHRNRLNSETSQNLRQHRDSFLQNYPLVDENSKYFGIPLNSAINIAHAKISILNNDTNSDQVLQYGKIPIVVAKCGVYLKRKGLNVEGIFRVGGSSKRLKELQLIFNSPPDFGKKLNWDGYNVHDAASILRRYLNALPEPLIPLDFYETFRTPLRTRPRIINYMKFKAENPNKSLKDFDSIEFSESNTNLNLNSNSNSNNNSNTDFQDSQEIIHKKNRKNYKKLTRDIHNSIQEFKVLVDQLPLLSKQLLFYILDLLAMVQNHANENLMSSRNLAAIFQPSILSHPNHDMDPIEYALSQVVVEFLIQYAYKLLPNQQELKKNVSNKNLNELNSSLQTTLIVPSKPSTTEIEIPKMKHPTNLLTPPNTSSNFRRQHSKSVSSNREEDYISTNIGQLEKPYLESEGDYNMEPNVTDGSSDDELAKIKETVNDTPHILVQSISQDHGQDEILNTTKISNPEEQEEKEKEEEPVFVVDAKEKLNGQSEVMGLSNSEIINNLKTIEAINNSQDKEPLDILETKDESVDLKTSEAMVDLKPVEMINLKTPKTIEVVSNGATIKSDV